jgi:hypothetical protein
MKTCIDAPCLLLGVALAIAGVLHYGLVSQTCDRPASLMLMQTDFAIDNVTPGEIIFSVPVSNTAEGEGRVVGISEACGRYCCYGPEGDLPLVIPAGARGAFLCKLKVRGPGPYSAEITIYLQDSELRETKIRVHGTVNSNNK